MSIIRAVWSREILDSRGMPTLEVDVHLEGGYLGRASVPAGVSVGMWEAHVLIDGDKKRYHGYGVQKAIQLIKQEIEPALLGKEACEQREIDNLLCTLDGTENKKRFGANTLLGVSLAVAKAQSQALQLPFFRYIGGVQAHVIPTPMMNIINGGLHANNGLAIQEFMIMPIGASHFSEALRMGSEIFQTLKALLSSRGYSTALGDEGGFAPDISDVNEAIELILNAIEASGYTPGEDVALALDAAASTFFNGKLYTLSPDSSLDKASLVQFWKELIEKYPIISLEDGMAENDVEGWEILSQELRSSIQLVGDDVFVTHYDRVQDGIEKNIANALLVKPNQVGTLTETLETVLLAQRKSYGCIFSHRSGETEDTALADLALATNCGQMKAGSLSRSERLCKYNQLLRLEEFLGHQAVYAGKTYISCLG